MHHSYEKSVVFVQRTAFIGKKNLNDSVYLTKHLHRRNTYPILLKLNLISHLFLPLFFFWGGGGWGWGKEKTATQFKAHFYDLMTQLGNPFWNTNVHLLIHFRVRSWQENTRTGLKWGFRKILSRATNTNCERDERPYFHLIDTYHTLPIHRGHSKRIQNSSLDTTHWIYVHCNI